VGGARADLKQQMREKEIKAGPLRRSPQRVTRWSSLKERWAKAYKLLFTGDGGNFVDKRIHSRQCTKPLSAAIRGTEVQTLPTKLAPDEGQTHHDGGSS